MLMVFIVKTVDSYKSIFTLKVERQVSLKNKVEKKYIILGPLEELIDPCIFFICFIRKIFDFFLQREKFGQSFLGRK